MTMITCPECAAEISAEAASCPRCGRAAPRRAAISGFGGKLKAIATVVVVLAVLATASGLWWGPALFLPGIALFMFGLAA